MEKASLPEVVSWSQWAKARADLLEREKAHTRAGDELAAARRRLPMTRIEPVNVLGPDGTTALREVFAGHRMLLVYHFMWNAGAPHHKQCEGCTHSQVSMTAAASAYLAARDVQYAVFSSGPLNEILAYRDFMGWTAPWYSTANSGAALATRDGGDLRCYVRHEESVYQTYETKWRGIEIMLPTLQLLDLTPLGRQETWEELPEGTHRDRPGTWWRQSGRPIAQWTRTNDPVM